MAGTAEPAANPEKVWWLKRLQIFEDQSDSLYNSVERGLMPIKFAKNDVLPLHSRTTNEKFIYAMLSGQVKLRSINEAGKEIILDVLGADDVFGPIEEVVSRDGRRRPPAADSPEAVAMSDGEAYRLGVGYFRDLVERRPNLNITLARFLGLRQKHLQIRLTRMLYRSSLGKLAGLLCELGERYGKSEGNTIQLTLQLTHQDLASIIGTKRDTVSRGLAELELMELIRYKRNTIVLLDPAKLDEVM